MKSYGIWLLILWCAVTLETARTDLVPPHSLTLPVAVACMLWFRSGGGILLGAGLLLLRWLLHSSAVPIDVLIPVTTVSWLLSRSTAGRAALAVDNRHLETAALAAVVAITVVAVNIVSEGWAPQLKWATAGGSAVTIFLLFTCGFRVAELLGVRRHPDGRSAARDW